MKGGALLAEQNTTFYKTVGKRVREIRTQKGLSQADLAAKAQLSLPVISSVENGHSRVWLSTFAKIAEALNVSADDILRLDTPGSTASFPAELKALLDGCDSSEKESILSIVKQVKDTFEHHKKSYTE